MEQELKDELRKLLLSAATKIDRVSYNQEPHYTAAFFGKLHKERIESKTGSFIELSFSSSDDRGRGSAESKTGIDLGMVFKWTDSSSGLAVEKAVLAQAKNNLFKLDARDSKDLSEQCQKMSQITSSYIVLDCPYDLSIPTICQSGSAPKYWKQPPIKFDEYLIDTVLQCLDGDFSEKVVKTAKRADRVLFVETNSPIPQSNAKTEATTNIAFKPKRK
jgi:hypothetical protein